MRLTVRLFAAFREHAGRDAVEVELPEGARVADLAPAVQRAIPALAPLLGVARPVVNHEFAPADQTLTAGDEVALLPPVSGGALDVTNFWLTGDRLEVGEVVERVEDPGCGAVVTFVGTVRHTNDGRDVDYLEYEAYPGMAEAKMAQIGDEIRARWGLERVAMVHRLGRCDIGEASIVIAVASPHRGEAFEACRYAIDRVKEIVPIWKREVWKDGAVWIGMHA